MHSFFHLHPRWTKIILNWHQYDVHSWHQLTINHKSKMKPKFCSPNVFASGHFLDTFLPSYGPHVLMAISYLQFDSRMSKSGLLMCHAMDQMLMSIWGLHVHRHIIITLICMTHISNSSKALSQREICTHKQYYTH